jgi:phage shock protein A
VTRQTKTPRQRAEEALASINRTVIRLDRKLDALKADLATVEREHTAAVARQAYARTHPDLHQGEETP